MPGKQLRGAHTPFFFFPFSPGILCIKQAKCPHSLVYWGQTEKEFIFWDKTVIAKMNLGLVTHIPCPTFLAVSSSISFPFCVHRFLAFIPFLLFLADFLGITG